MVVKVTDIEVEVESLLGSYASMWTRWKPKDKSNIERLHRNVVIMSGIELTKTKRLKADDIRTLKLIYSSVESMWLHVSTNNDKYMFTSVVWKWKIGFSMFMLLSYTSTCISRCPCTAYTTKTATAPFFIATFLEILKANKLFLLFIMSSNLRFQGSQGLSITYRFQTCMPRPSIIVTTEVFSMTDKVIDVSRLPGPLKFQECQSLWNFNTARAFEISRLSLLL